MVAALGAPRDRLPDRKLSLMVALLRGIEAVGRNNSSLVVLLRDEAEFRDEAHRVMLEM